MKRAGDEGFTVKRPGLRGTFLGDRWAAVAFVVVVAAGALIPAPAGPLALAFTVAVAVGIVAHARLSELTVAPGRLRHRRLIRAREVRLPPGAQLRRVPLPGPHSWGTREDQALTAVVTTEGEVLMRWSGRWAEGPRRIADVAGLAFEDRLGEPLTAEDRAVLPPYSRRPVLYGLALGGVLTAVVLAAVAGAS